MKIVLVQSSPYLPSLGGANKGNRLLLEQLAARGHACHALAVAGEGVEAGVARHAGVEVDAVREVAQLRGHVAERLSGLAADWVLVSSEDPAQMLLEAALEVCPERVVYIAHTTLHLPFGPDGFLPSPARTDLLRRAAGILVLSDYLRDYFERWAGLAATVLRVPVYGRGPFPALGDFDRGAVTLINPCAVKGIAIFLELARRCPDLPFLAVPTWGTTAEDKAALAALPNVRLRPPSPDVDEIFRETRVLLVPSVWGEAFGHVAVEAMLRGIPVLASDVGGLPEAKLGVDYVLPVEPVRRYEERFDEKGIPVAAVPAQDAGPWERALRELLGDRERYGRLAEESRRAAHGFVRNHGAEAFERYFAGLSAGLSPAAPARQAAPAAVSAAGVSQKLDRLSPARLELLKRRLRRKEETAPARAGIPRLQRDANGENAFPLSFAQQRIWLLHRLDPERADYNECLALRITGRLRPAVLAAALSEIVRRHEVLRTQYMDTREGPVQVIAAPSPLPQPEVDLCALPPELRESAAIRLACEEGRRPFALAEGPVLRTALLRLLRLGGAAEHLLLFTVHHIAADSWSITVALRELAELYRALAAGEPPTLPELPIQYADFSVWQRQWLSGEVLAAQLAAWRAQLAGAPPLSELPTDRPRPAVQGHGGATVSRHLPRPLAAALQSLARHEDVTLYMLLLAAFAILLHHYSGAADLVVGTPIVGRGRKETEGLIGFFLNSLPMRVRPASGLTVRGLLEQVRSTAVEAFAHQDLPFERLVEELAPQRDPSTTPIFQVFLNFQSTPPEGLELEGLRSVAVPVERGVTKLDLDLYIEENEQGLLEQMTYSTDLFDAATVVRLLGHFQALLAQLERGIERPLSALRLLTAAEAHQLAAEWNDTGRPSGGTAGVHQLVVAQAARTPEATAVVYAEESLTYAELCARAARLARRLQAIGIGPESRVAVAMERSLELLPALLGVLAAGAAYVPLDPEHPRERLAGLLADSRPAALLTPSWRLSALPEWDGPRLCLDRDEVGWAGGGEGGEGAPDGFLDGSQLAYVIYTSGSTGRPKGVEVSHGALASFLRAMAERPGLEAGDVLLAVTTLSFDIAALELLLPLTLGARVVVASRETAADGTRLAAAIERAGATVLQATPATWRMLLGAGWAGSPGLTALSGGEALPRDLARDLLARTAALWNLYGPTETTVWSAVHPVRETARTVALGRPIAGTSIHLVDRGCWSVPSGVPGELLIGGAGVARGYGGRPDLTAERFVPDPFGPPGARLYKTGDLARALPGGESEFLGRIDHQVKIRGFRIEPGEIETVLGEHPGVRQAAVLARAADGEARLVAYVVPAGEAPTAAALQDFLAARLPAYMVPAVFTALDALPLSPSGKVDRGALPEPEAGRLGSGAPFVPPGTPVERELARLWSEALGCPEVSCHDSFFALGGHSMLATRLIPRYREAFGVELELRQLFEAPTLEQLARLIDSLQKVRTAPPLVRVPRGGPLPLSFAQQRLWLLDQIEPGSFAYNLTGSVRLRGPLDVAALARVLSEIVRRHESLRTCFVDGIAGSGPEQVIAPPAPVPLPQVDLAFLPPSAREAAVLRLAEEEARRPFALARGPLLRLGLLRAAGEEHALLVTLHHTVSDGWSMGLFVRELKALYRAFSAGRPSPLPELPIQYADFAVWQRRWLAGPVLAEQLAYWTGRLAGAPPALPLPADRPRPATRSYRGAQVVLPLGRALGAALDELALRLDATPFMLLVGGFSALLSHYSGQTDLVLGTPIANRAHAELEELIGFFTNTLCLRTDLGGDPDVALLVERVREAALGAYDHQDLPFERLVEALRPERDLSTSPVFQVMLTLQNLPRTDLTLSGLALSPLPIDRGRAPFDLSLTFFPGPAGDDDLFARLEYALDLFDAATAERLLAHLQALLTGIAADPGRRVADLPLLSAEERDQLLALGNGPAEPLPEVLVHQLFEAAAASRPAAVAVAQESWSLSYGELDARANRLAHRLRRLGIGPEARVGVCVERSPSLLTALLAVLKAGGAYLPLDPAHPADRLAWVLADSRATLLLTTEDLAAQLPPLPAETAVVRLDALDLSGESAAPLPPLALPQSLAYVIYTSGSTGRPKGVAVEQRGVVNFLAAMARRPGLGAADVMAAVTTVGFDIAVLELFLPLAVGARVELVDRETAADGLRLAVRLAASSATVMQATPATWRLLLESGWEGVSHLTVLCGGEALSPELARALAARARSLWNVYGPTETTVWSAVHPVSAAETGGGRPIPLSGPLGGPIANTALHLLGPFATGLTPVPQGAVGELYIAGLGLARGYLNRPDLTAERFVPDPFAAPGARLYRTGDLVRRLRGGGLEFLGRADQQVKLRGFRIELGEIEAVLGGAAAVRRCAVVVREDVAGARRLVAYLALCDGSGAATPADLADLAARLRAQLPDYMVPQVLVPLAELPLTPNGKIDRRALLALPAPEGAASAEHVVPRNRREEVLAAVWAEVLDRDRVSVHDNFFALGGDSILAMRAVARSRSRGLRFTPRQLFQNQTIGELAAVAQAVDLAAEGERLAPLPAVAAPTEPGRLAADDFPLAGLDQTALEALFAELIDEAEQGPLSRR